MSLGSNERAGCDAGIRNMRTGVRSLELVFTRIHLNYRTVHCVFAFAVQSIFAGGISSAKTLNLTLHLDVAYIRSNQTDL